MSVHLLGRPRIDVAGTPSPGPRGNKAWGLFAYLLRTRVPPSRAQVAGLLFSEADDPLGALRWTLSNLRSRLGDDVELGGDPLRLRLSPGSIVDVEVLSTGSWVEASSLPGLGRPLLDGMSFGSSPAFDMWLELERRHVAGSTCAVLHQAALALLARGEVEAATGYASELVRLNPYEENAHVLLVRCLRAGGDVGAAVRHAEACTALFVRDLGTTPTPALRTAAASSEIVPTGRVSGPAAVRALLEAGDAALAAGAVETGLHRLRGAIAAARSSGDLEQLATALVAMGGALVHAARGTDEEGAAALHEGTTLAEQIGRHDVAATGWREISWVQFLRSHYERAELSLTRTAELAAGSAVEMAWVELIRGACRHDVGDYAAAGELLHAAEASARRLDTGQPLGQALTMLGRYHLMRGEIDDAVRILDEALEQAEARGMTAFVPWPESFRAEIDLVRGDLVTAEARFEHAFALGCQVGDPCWEGISLRGLGLVSAARGDTIRALELLADAPKLCRRLPDTYRWIEVYSFDALCSVAVGERAAAAGRWVERLEAIAARRGMRELLLRAAVYRATLGEPGAADVARSLAVEVDNPSLASVFEPLRAVLVDR